MRRELLGAGVKVALVRMAGMGAGFCLTVVLARALGPGALGLYAYAITLLSLAAVPVNNGWATTLLREASRGEAGPHWPHVRGMVIWGARAAAIASACALLIALGARWVTGSEAYGAQDIGLLALVLLFDQISGLRLSVLRGLNHPVWGQVPEMLFRPALILVIFLLLTVVSSGPITVTHAFLSLCTASLLTSVLGVIILRWKAPAELSAAQTQTNLSVWFKSAAVLAGNAWLVVLNSQIDFLMLGALATAEQLGHYRVAMQIALFSGAAYVALNMIAMQRFSKLFSAGKMQELQTAATFMSRIAFAATLPLPAIFWFAGEPILTHVFGPEYSGAVKATLLLLAVQSASSLFGFARTMLVMANMEKKILPVTIFAIVLNVATCGVLIPLYQIEGAALAALISGGFWNLVLYAQCRKLTGVDTSIFGRSRLRNA
tara:strand:+ start:41839 stop:43137 length:1299 start_codon:yes stop_codon:yes gene_type:complete